MALIALIGGACRSSPENAVSRAPASASALPSTAPAATTSAAPTIQKPVKLGRLADGAYPSSLSPARVVPRAAKTGDGCHASRIFDAHGTLDDEPARAKVEAFGKRITIRASPLGAGRARVFSLTLDQSLCAFGPMDLLDATGKVTDSPELRAHFTEIPPCMPDGGRLNLEISNDSGSVLSVLSVRPERLSLHDKFEKALGSALDIEAVLELPNGGFAVAYLSSVERELGLAVLAGSPLAATHTTLAGLACGDSSCEAELDGFVLPNGSIALIPKLAQTGCSLHGYRSTSAKLWTLGSEGFVGSVPLPGSDEHNAGANYPATSTEVRLFWVNADEEQPFAVLAQADGGGEAPRYELFPYDPTRKVFEASDRALDDPKNAGAVTSGGEFMRF
jgi:hypothetical protein